MGARELQPRGRVSVLIGALLCSLRDTLVSYLETKDCEVPELEQFPEEILLSSCVPVWKAAAALKRGRQAR